jgi:hypothetical protein
MHTQANNKLTLSSEYIILKKYIELIETHTLILNIIIFGWLQHKLSYFYFYQNFQEKKNYISKTLKIQ